MASERVGYVIGGDFHRYRAQDSKEEKAVIPANKSS